MVGMKQEMRQSQQLVMTQQLQQSIKLLQLSAVELQEFIDEEIEKNPLLQRDEESEAPPAPAEESEGEGEKPESPEAPQAEVEMSDNDYSAGEALEDESYANEWGQEDALSMGRVSASSGAGGGAFDEEREGSGIEGASARDKTLREHLLEQIHVDIHEPWQLVIAEKLADMLDEAGYLREDPSALAEQLGASREDVDITIARLQEMDPPGVFARDLAECLRIQLDDMNRLDPVMELMLQNLEMIGQGDLVGLRKKCGVDDEDFAQMLADIRRCNPKPGSGFAYEDAQAVIPDVILRRGKKGGWLVELNQDALPRVLVNRHYAATVGGREEKEAKKFLGEQLATANWLVKALDQRAQTILKVAQEIVKQQEKFLQHGIRFLKPLVLKDIAAAVGMHESTISRVTTSKFMSTPRGTLEFKFFFTSSVGSAAGGSDFSSKTVQFYIKDLIEAESADTILSDDAIVKRLKDKNIDVARRTVTKYREEMNIPSSVIRRRQKKASA